MMVNFLNFLVLSLLLAPLMACSPRVELQSPDKPLEINLNVKIDHQISVRVDKQLDEVMNKNEAIF